VHFQQLAFAKSERVSNGHERAQPELMAGVLGEFVILWLLYKPTPRRILVEMWKNGNLVDLSSRAAIGEIKRTLEGCKITVDRRIFRLQI